jgi:hypothetical protein
VGGEHRRDTRTRTAECCGLKAQAAAVDEISEARREPRGDAMPS